MPRESFKFKRKEAIVVTEEEIQNKNSFLEQLKELEKEESLENLKEQKEILLKLKNLDQERKERIKEGEIEISGKIYKRIIFGDLKKGDFIFATKDIINQHNLIVFTTDKLYKVITDFEHDRIETIDDQRNFHTISLNGLLDKFIPYSEK